MASVAERAVYKRGLKRLVAREKHRGERDQDEQQQHRAAHNKPDPP
ncbi:MAG: hypothetical protein WKF84_24755 [Pyrinomonadaceae bacterium]